MRSQTFAEKQSRRAKRREKLGATGDYPHGKLNPTDEGGLTIAIGNEGDTVVIRFGKKIAWIGLPPDQAVTFAMTILKRAGLRGMIVIGDGDDDASNLRRSGEAN